jgi:heavy metal sensor kinase
VKLATRISLFFLVALAVVLTGFSASVYWIVRTQSYSETNARLAATLDTIAAAIENGPDGLEWEPGERNLFSGKSASADATLWQVAASGHRIDGSKEPESALTGLNQADDDHFDFKDVDWRGERWRVARRDIRAAAPGKVAAGATEPGTTRYQRLTISSAASLAPVEAHLRNLAIALLTVSVLVWLIAAALGRSFCKHALAPLTEMSAAISTISAADLDRRVPSNSTGDELDQLGHAFNELLNRLQAAFTRQTRFAAEASHQLRTPLTAMIGQVEVALRRDRSTFEYRAALENVHQNCEQLRRIIESLLVLAREGTDAALQQSHRIDLGDWLVKHLAGWSGHPRFADIRVEVDPQQPLTIAANDALLAQVLDNVLDNACKYSAPMSPIEVRAAKAGDDVVLSVKDNGRGISQSELSRVRDPFFRSDDVRRLGISGVGLGLSVVQRIVDAFGATLSINSEPGRFSVVTIRFRALPLLMQDTIPNGASRTVASRLEAIGR